MRKIAIATVAAVIIAGGAYYALAILPGKQFRAGLDQVIAALPPGYTAHYGEARYGLFRHLAEVTDLTIQAPPPLSTSETIAKITIEKPSFSLAEDWNRAQANSAALKPDQALPIADRITVEGVKLSGGMATGGVASMTLAKPRVYPWSLFRPGVPPLKYFGAAFTNAMAAEAQIAAQRKALLDATEKSQDQDGDSDQGTAPALPTAADVQKLEKAQIEALLPVIKLEAAGFLALGYDGFDGAGLDVTTALPASGPAIPSGNIRIAISKVHGDALDRGIGGANAIDGLTEELGPQGKISAEHASIGNMAIRDAATRLLNGDPLSMAMLDGTTLGAMEMDGMAMDLPVGGQVEIQKINLADLAFEHSFLKSFTFNMTGFKQDAADMVAQEKAALQQIGLKTVSANIGVAFNWDADKKTASIHDVMFGVDKLGSVAAGVDLIDFDPAGLSTGEQPKLAKGTLHLQNISLIGRLLKMDGKKTPAELSQLRQQYAAGLLATLGPIASDPKLAGSVQAINDFAKTPRGLTLTLAPPMPVPLDELKTVAAGGPAALIDRLGVSVTANP